MPSSLIFAGLAVAWLVVLVPMVAKRRQEVVRTAESALTSRVLRRPGPLHAPLREVPMISERIAPPEPVPDGRRYRPGRGGYDPDIAEQVARAKYVYRQRVVLGLAVGAVVTLVLAFTATSLLWWAHAALDVALVGYLGYLRTQVRIEEEVRHRRAARLAGFQSRMPPVPFEVPFEAPDEAHVVHEDAEPPAAAPPAPHPTAVAVDLDDEDPVFDDLDRVFEPRYRRAVGE
ncbi:MAG TPA: gephyrin-like molybdotransferase receptor GlpR [Pseudonocardiaceae bacterium]